MPRARLTLKAPAASAAPVPPAHTSACALPSATALAACTIEASGVARAAPTGSALLAIDTGASTTSTPAGRLPSCPAGPNRITRTPRPTAIEAPAATSAGPRSAPLQSTATTAGRESSAGMSRDAPAEARGRLLVLAVLVLVIVARGPWRHDLAARVAPAHGADPVRAARTVALRTGIDRGA